MRPNDGKTRFISTLVLATALTGCSQVLDQPSSARTLPSSVVEITVPSPAISVRSTAMYTVRPRPRFTPPWQYKVHLYVPQPE